MKKFMFLMFIIISSCSSSNNGEKTLDKYLSYSNAEVIIYKTKLDYYNFVPITLSSDKSEIVSFPHPTDLIINQNNLSLPIKLKNGYLLDIRGINENSVFLNITYEQYSKLDTLPSIEFLKKCIFDYNPITEMYNCGYRSSYKNIVEELNDKIKNNNFKDFKKIK